MQGQLKNEYLSAVIETACRHCGRAVHIRLDSKMAISSEEPDASPLVFTPDVDFGQLMAPNILHAY